MISLMRNQLPHTVGIHILGFIMCGSYKVALFTVLLNAVDVGYYYFRFVTVMFKMREHGSIYYDILLCGE